MASIERTLEYMLENITVLGSKLGTVLFQLPPSMKVNLERLRAFLELLPAELAAAFEFRHPSWFDDEVYTALHDHNAALVIADSDDPTKTPPFVRTADWGYLRLRRPGYDAAALQTWAERLADPAWSRAFVYFKHEDAGAGPKLAEELRRLAG